MSDAESRKPECAACGDMRYWGFREGHDEVMTKIRRALEAPNIRRGPEFLEWVADRLAYVYDEPPTTDFIFSLREKARLERDALALLEEVDDQG